MRFVRLLRNEAPSRAVAREVRTIVLLAILSGCASATKQARTPTPGKANILVMTYNVNYGLRGDRDTISVIANTDADAIFLQETTPAWERALRTPLSKQYPHIHFLHTQAAGGLAVLSKYKVDVELLGPSVASGWFPAMRAVVHAPGGKVQVLNVHLRPPVSDGGSFISGYFVTPKIREAEIGAFTTNLDPDLPTLVVGDFNEKESGRASKLLKTKGFEDVLGQFQPSATTWRWPTVFGELTSTLDHIMYDARFAPLNAKVLKVGRSDHLPVIAHFELTETKD